MAETHEVHENLCDIIFLWPLDCWDIESNWIYCDATLPPVWYLNVMAANSFTIEIVSIERGKCQRDKQDGRPMIYFLKLV